MKTVEERVKEAQEAIIPTLKELFVDIGSEPLIKPDGTLSSRLVWVDTTPKSDIIVPSSEIIAPLK